MTCRLAKLHALPFAPVLCTGICLTWMIAALPVEAAETLASDDRPLSGRAISLLHEQCFSCHNEEDRKGGLILTSRAAIEAANQEFNLIVPSDPDSSRLITVLAAEADPHMPPKAQLDQASMQLRRTWIERGTPWEEVEKNVPSAPMPAERASLRPPPRDVTPVLAIARSSDEHRLASGLGNQILVTESAKSEEAHSLPLTGHRGFVRALAWNPMERRHLASGGYRRVVYWETDAYEPVTITEALLEGQVTALQFSHDGSRLWAGISRPGISGQIICWRIPEFEPLALWEAHRDSVLGLDLSDDGSYLASAGADRTLVFWETDTLEERIRSEAHGTQIMALSLSSDGRRIATAGTDPHLRGWDWPKGDPLFLLGRHKQGLFAVHWARQADAIFVGDERGGLFRYSNIKDHSGAAGARAAD